MAKWVVKDVKKYYNEQDVSWFTKAVMDGKFGESARFSKQPSFYYLRCAVTEARKQLTYSLGKRAFDPSFIEHANKVKGTIPWKSMVEIGNANAVLGIQHDIDQQARINAPTTEADSFMASLNVLRPTVLAVDLKLFHYKMFCANKIRERAELAGEILAPRDVTARGASASATAATTST